MKTRIICFEDQTGKPCQFKHVDGGAQFIALVVIQHDKDHGEIILADGRKVVTVAKGLNPERIAAHHAQRVGINNVQIIREWRTI